MKSIIRVDIEWINPPLRGGCTLGFATLSCSRYPPVYSAGDNTSLDFVPTSNFEGDESTTRMTLEQFLVVIILKG